MCLHILLLANLFLTLNAFRQTLFQGYFFVVFPLSIYIFSFLEELKPRKLSLDEVKSSTNLPLAQFMQSLNSSWHKNGTEGRHPTVALVRVAPGTNTKPDPRDSIRYARREV